MRTVFGLVLVLSACTAPSSFAPATTSGGAVPATSSNHLLYISDLYNSVVDIYTVPSLKFVRRLTGLFEPQGECTNAAGDVWIVNTGYQEIIEYAPGASKPMAALPDDLGYPASCAINPVNGDLAVTDEYAKSGTAQVLIYPNASGTPQAFRNPNAAGYVLAAYDDKGRLYVSGETVHLKYVLSVLPVHARSLTTVRVSGATIHQAGSVLWNSGKLILGDQACRGGKTSCLYVTTVNGTTATVTSTIALGDACDVVQVTLYGGALYGGNDDQCSQGKSSVDRWSYPKGQREDGAYSVREPIGAAISGPATERP